MKGYLITAAIALVVVAIVFRVPMARQYVAGM